jgi:hypothetical protein
MGRRHQLTRATLNRHSDPNEHFQPAQRSIRSRMTVLPVSHDMECLGETAGG